MTQQILEMLILATVAVVLLFRLKGMLGYRSGHEKIISSGSMVDVHDSVGSKKGEESGVSAVSDVGSDDDVADGIFEDGKHLHEILKEIKAAYPEFSLKHFVDGAKEAYPMIMEAYYSGDTEVLREYVSDEVYPAFGSAVEERKEHGIRCDFSYVYMRSLNITAMETNTDDTLEISVKFVSDIILSTYDSEGNLSAGDPKKIAKITDVWTFSRCMKSDDPLWLVVATSE